MLHYNVWLKDSNGKSLTMEVKVEPDNNVGYETANLFNAILKACPNVVEVLEVEPNYNDEGELEY